MRLAQIGQAIQRQQRPCITAQEQRGDVDQPFIHQACRRKGATQYRAGLDLDLVAPLLSQDRHDLSQVKPFAVHPDLPETHTRRWWVRRLDAGPMKHQGRCRAIQHMGLGIALEMLVEHHPQRNGKRRVRVGQAHRQARVVRQQRATAGEHRAGPGAPHLHIVPGLGRGDPFGLPVTQGRATVQAHGQFDPQPWPLAFGT